MFRRIAERKAGIGANARLSALEGSMIRMNSIVPVVVDQPRI
jgi:hypothetical protein